MCMYVHMCMYFLQQKVLVVRIHTNMHTYAHTYKIKQKYAQICTRYARHMHTYAHIHTLSIRVRCKVTLYVSVCICWYVYVCHFKCKCVCICIYAHVCARILQTCISVFTNAYVQNACICLYHVCMLYVCVFFACIWYVSCMCQYVYVLYVLAQTNTLTNITWPTDLLQGPQHAGPTQGSDEQVPICFVPPSKTTCQTRFGALPRAARVEGVQLGFRVSPTGPPCAFIHW